MIITHNAGMLIVALQPLSAVAVEMYVPPLSVTLPVGVGLPLPPLTVTVTESLCAVVMLVEAGVTVTVGVIFETVTEPLRPSPSLCPWRLCRSTSCSCPARRSL